jgi:pyrimidine-specific ribonucleoside hydrolase
MRAISLLLSLPSITIKAILLSDGSLSPNDGVEKVKSLLHEFNRDTIPVACGVAINGVNPPWRAFNKQLNWGKTIPIQTKCIDAFDKLSEQLNLSKEKITLVCMGPLTNIAQLAKKAPALLSNIDRIIWYTESINPLTGFNYDCDKESADLVMKSGVRIDLIMNLKKEGALFDSAMYSVCQQSKTLLATVLYNFHHQPVVYEKMKQNHFKLWDELLILYITNPELFLINTIKNDPKIRYNLDYNATGTREAMCDMIKGTYVSEHNIVFKEFPDKPEMFTYDVRQIMDSAILRYGHDEWKANVMTDEFHGHLGVFSIVGAKMGIKARELFGVGPDQLEVITFAGSKPPYSCMNDGIQVSTGATLGMGTIHVSADSIKRPSAIFTYKKQSIQLSLKKEFLEKINTDISEGITKFGLSDDGYWKLIRYNALKYWLEWDRDKIFDIKELD